MNNDNGVVKMSDWDFLRVQRLTEELKNNVVQAKRQPIEMTIDDGKKNKVYEFNDYFGSKDAWYKVRAKFDLKKMDQYKQYALYVSTTSYEDDNSRNPQIKLIVGGELIQAFDVNHHYYLIDSDQFNHEIFEPILEIYSGREDRKYALRIAVVTLDLPTYDRYFDFKTYLDCWDSLKEVPNMDSQYRKILLEASNQLDFRKLYSDSYYCGLKKAANVLEQLHVNDDSGLDGNVFAVGHTHIDMAWLWTVEQAIEKGERSFATVLDLMQRYPDFYFMHSTPQLYSFIKDRYPKLFQKIKKAIKDGHWEAEGAMWVEADCNLTSGESLVRQILYGKNFLKKEFGVDSKILWLPDVFGYSAALPQILKKSGIDYFMTTKLAWNDTNEIPMDSFEWQGIDGTTVLTHLINTVSEGYRPTPWFATYSAMLNARVVKKSWDKYKQKQQNDAILIAYGYGDGGGGPTFQMIETAKRLSKKTLGMPKVQMSSAKSFFDHLAVNNQIKPLPKWIGELYFENHRGTYTSIAKNKFNNRRSELRLQDVEKLFVAYTPATYPKEILDSLWKRLLLNQFHDILPGSSIDEVYAQTDRDYKDLERETTELLSKFGNDVFRSNEDNIVVYNSIGKTRSIIVPLKSSHSKRYVINDNCELRTQRVEENKVLLELPDRKPYSFTNVKVLPPKDKDLENINHKEDLSKVYENENIIIHFDKNYNIISLFDKNKEREVVPQGDTYNQFVAYEDFPSSYDNWNIDRNYEKKSWLVNKLAAVPEITRGNIRDTIQIKRIFNKSIIKQSIYIYHGQSKIEFDTDIDWNEHHVLLRVLFPIDVNAQAATFDIQFGNVKRSLSQNNSWEQARFEVAGQKWADLSEYNFGVSLLTDSKYGYSAKYKQLGLSLIKSGTEPNPSADQGKHHFIYSTLIHRGSWQEGSTFDEALNLNSEPLVWRKKECPNGKVDISFVSCNSRNIYIDTLKMAESDKDLVVRMYEYENSTTETTLKFQNKIKDIVITDLLENRIDSNVEFRNEYSIKLKFKPYEIKTIRVKFK